MRLGQVVEQGTHDQLVAEKGEYARLVEAQQVKETRVILEAIEDVATPPLSPISPTAPAIQNVYLEQPVTAVRQSSDDTVSPEPLACSKFISY
jgi:hypothetical protein